MATGGAYEDARDLDAACYSRLVRVVSVAADDRAEAEDVVQEAFVHLLSRWPGISRYDDPEAWVRKVAFRLLSSERRRRRRRSRWLAGRTALPPAESSGDPGLSGDVSDVADSVDVERALAALPAAWRRVVALHHLLDLLDLPVEQVAADLRLPAGTVKSRLHRARAALATMLGPISDEETPHA